MKPEPSIARVSDVVGIMEAWAPSWTAESWDNVGLLAGDPNAPAGKIATALEMSEDLLEWSLAEGVGMILTHHPPIFSPLKKLRTDDPATRRLIKAASRGVALFAAHTNLDSADGGVNDTLAESLGIIKVKPLKPLGRGMAKLVVFVPESHQEEVAQALFQAGAGHIGRYFECAFAVKGEGGFFAPEGSRPYVGSPGQGRKVDEIRLETLIPLSSVSRAISALFLTHPYEQPAYDVYPLEQGPAGCGMGRVGDLVGPIPFEEFFQKSAQELGSCAPQAGGVCSGMVSRVAVVSGAGADYLPQARAAGAQVLVTGEARHHQAQEALDMGMSLVCLGHFETEQIVVTPWAERLAMDLASEGYTNLVKSWSRGGNPWRSVAGKKKED